MSSELTIGEVARRAGVNVQTLRYYERRKLLQPVTRKSSGYRLYDEEAVRRLRFIRNAQELGFTLKEIAQLLELRVDDAARCGDVKRQAEAKLSEIERKLKELKRLKWILKDLVRDCEARRPTSDCPVLHGLEERG